MPNTPAGTDEALVRLAMGGCCTDECAGASVCNVFDPATWLCLPAFDRILTRLATAERQRDAAVRVVEAARGMVPPTYGNVSRNSERLRAALTAYDATPGPKPSEESA
jgi:hypothetical protein